MESRIGSAVEEELNILTPLIDLFNNLQPPWYDLIEAVAEVREDVQADECVWNSVVRNCIDNGDNIKTYGIDETLLTVSEIAAITLYSAEFGKNGGFYSTLNKLLRDKDRKKLRKYVKYIWLLMHGLSKCPESSVRTVYRGMKFDSHAEYLVVFNMYPERRKFVWHQFSSCTTNANVLNVFCGQTGWRIFFSVELTTNRARDISAFSLSPNECEVLLPANSSFIVIGFFEIAIDCVMIQLREEFPNDPIMIFRSISQDIHRDQQFGYSPVDAVVEDEEDEDCHPHAQIAGEDEHAKIQDNQVVDQDDDAEAAIVNANVFQSLLVALAQLLADNSGKAAAKELGQFYKTQQKLGNDYRPHVKALGGWTQLCAKSNGLLTWTQTAADNVNVGFMTLSQPLVKQAAGDLLQVQDCAQDTIKQHQEEDVSLLLAELVVGLSGVDCLKPVALTETGFAELVEQYPVLQSIPGLMSVCREIGLYADLSKGVIVPSLHGSLSKKLREYLLPSGEPKTISEFLQCYPATVAKNSYAKYVDKLGGWPQFCRMSHGVFHMSNSVIPYISMKPPPPVNPVQLAGIGGAVDDQTPLDQKFVDAVAVFLSTNANRAAALELGLFYKTQQELGNDFKSLVKTMGGWSQVCARSNGLFIWTRTGGPSNLNVGYMTLNLQVQQAQPVKQCGGVGGGDAPIVEEVDVLLARLVVRLSGPSIAPVLISNPLMTKFITEHNELSSDSQLQKVCHRVGLHLVDNGAINQTLQLSLLKKLKDYCPAVGAFIKESEFVKRLTPENVKAYQAQLLRLGGLTQFCELSQGCFHAVNDTIFRGQPTLPEQGPAALDEAFVQAFTAFLVKKNNSIRSQTCSEFCQEHKQYRPLITSYGGWEKICARSGGLFVWRADGAYAGQINLKQPPAVKKMIAPQAHAPLDDAFVQAFKTFLLTKSLSNYTIPSPKCYEFYQQDEVHTQFRFYVQNQGGWENICARSEGLFVWQPNGAGAGQISLGSLQHSALALAADDPDPAPNVLLPVSPPAHPSNTALPLDEAFVQAFAAFLVKKNCSVHSPLCREFYQQSLVNKQFKGLVDSHGGWEKICVASGGVFVWQDDGTGTGAGNISLAVTGPPPDDNATRDCHECEAGAAAVPDVKSNKSPKSWLRNLFGI